MTTGGRSEFTGRLVGRYDPGYERLRRAAIWNARRPDRFPDLILLAADEADVARGVRLAADRGMRVGIRSGGHSWIANGVRNGGLLIDLSRLAEIRFDEATGLVALGPAARGAAVDAALARFGRFFPTGHAPSVGVGGFLLGGGYGWNSRVHGPACLSIEAVDVVTATGEIVRADAGEHPGLLWAARGCGPGFFGVVTRFHLRTYRRPTIHRAVRTYPLDRLDEVVTWSQETAPWLPARLEIAIKIGAPPGEAEKVITIVGTAFGEDGAALLDALADAPFASPTGDGSPPSPITMADLYEESGRWSEAGLRWAVDGIWTDGPTADVVAGTRAMVEAIPGSGSFVFILPWGAYRADVPAAWSVQAANYVSPVAAWTDPALDGRHRAWVTDTTKAMEPVSRGVQFSDADPASRPDSGLSPRSQSRLADLRHHYDPNRVFTSYLTAADL
ncbi:FAD-binding oxidoreductase [Nonomuraea sp. NEAU-A123]|uniref:FAD-binding oxidoreductase n=1 Tax=Nonomuraea sp. NEAU-A123 TaxID=2839649 RepID=UPI001BE494D9|nr:FAD-binding oxidoreductase [Nonomuraea sp. NEAU-A123]MBT2225748.1 FAD-binding oxidoreductase [Nonomuraea sp. NEAU-A123]